MSTIIKWHSSLRNERKFFLQLEETGKYFECLVNRGSKCRSVRITGKNMNEYSHIKIIIMKDLKLHPIRKSSRDSPSVHPNWDNLEPSVNSIKVNFQVKRFKNNSKSDPLRKCVFKNAVSALLYPHREHNLVMWTASSPVYCSTCEGLLWGITKDRLYS